MHQKGIDGTEVCDPRFCDFQCGYGEEPAAKGLYEQLLLTTEAEDFSNNEKIFYPPEKPDITDTPQAASGASLEKIYSYVSRVLYLFVKL